METISSSRDLPDELVVKIIAMMPFPEIFKARTLSKSWLERFSEITVSSQGKPVRKSRVTRYQKQVEARNLRNRLATSFQKQVSEYSSKWQIFCPISVGAPDAWGCEGNAHNWRRIPSISFLPRDVVTYSEQIIEGALLFAYHYDFGPVFPKRKNVYVANLLTRSWKVLPPRPNQHHIYKANVVIQSATQTYKVILFCAQAPRVEDCSAQIYDSKSNAWSSKNLPGSGPLHVLRSFVHLDGVLYTMRSVNCVLCFDIEEGAFRELSLLSRPDMSLGYYSEVLLVSGKSLLMIRVEGGSTSSPQTLRILKIDVKTGKWGAVAQGPPSILEPDAGFRMRVVSFIGYGDFVYFGADSSRGRALVYSLSENSWTSFPYHCSSSLFCSITGRALKNFPFQPGLSPFLPV